MGVYKKLTEIDNTDLFIYTAVIIAIGIITTRVAPSATLLVGLVIGIAVVYMLNDKKMSEQSDYVQKIVSILKEPDFSSRRYLHLDSIIVEFLEEYKDYKGYNPQVYEEFVTLLDSYLHIAQSIERTSINYTHDFERLIDLKSKILNIYHSFLYRVPHTQMHLKKFHDGTAKLTELLNDHLDLSNRTVLEKSAQEGISIHTKFHYKSHPKATDPDWKGSSFHS